MDLAYEKKTAWEQMTKKDLDSMNKLSDEYIDFMNRCKTERESCDEIVEQAKANGFISLEEALKKRNCLKE